MITAGHCSGDTVGSVPSPNHTLKAGTPTAANVIGVISSRYFFNQGRDIEFVVASGGDP